MAGHGIISLALVAIAALLVSGESGTDGWTNLKVTFGLNPMTSFNGMPRTATDAEAKGWRSISAKDCTNGGKFFGNRYVLGEDIAMALLFDRNGIIAGIQVNLLKTEIKTPENNYKFDQVHMYQSDIIENQEVYSLTAYFVEPSTICSRGRSDQDLEKGTGTMLKFQNGPTPASLIDVPLNRSQAINEGWSKNECFYGMGYHNFYKSEEFETTNCSEVRPAFLLFNGSGDLHGFGFATAGYVTSSRFEHPSARALKGVIGQDVAQCLLDKADTIKFSSLHVSLNDPISSIAGSKSYFQRSV